MAAAGSGWGGGVDRRGASYLIEGTVINGGDRALEAARLALDLGADINAANEAGDTALHRAAAKGSTKLVEFLVERGARLDVENKRGQTPLAIASRSGAARSSSTGTRALVRKLGPKSDSQ